MRAGSAQRVAATTYGEAFTPDPVRVSAKVSREVAGLGAIHAADLRKALGTAWFAYRKLLELRDPKTGVVTTTAKLLAKALPRAGRGEKVTEKGLREQLRKLEGLRLVETIARPSNPKMGPKRRLYYKTKLGTTAFKLVVDRRVFGAPQLGHGELYAIPFQAQLVLEAKAAAGGSRSNSGGARKGAGRPKGRRSGTGKGRFRRYSEGPRMSAERLIAQTEALFPGSVSGGPEFSKFSPTNSKLQSSVRASSLLLSLLFPSLGLRASLPSKEGSEGPSATAPLLSLSRDESDDPNRVVSENGIVTNGELVRRGFAASVSPFVGGKHKLIPSRVSVATHPDLALVVPPPPRLNPKDTPERHAYLLMRWYEGACRLVLGKEPGTFKRFRNGPAASPHFDLLKEAAQAFIKHDVAPAAWCAFSADVWKRTESKGMPPLKFVFSAKRVEERVGWYRSEEGNYSGGRILFTPAAREFAARQQSMHNVSSRVRTEAELRLWVERHFPGDLFYELLDRIREEASQLRDELAGLVEMGEWLW